MIIITMFFLLGSIVSNRIQLKNKDSKAIESGDIFIIRVQSLLKKDEAPYFLNGEILKVKNSKNSDNWTDVKSKVSIIIKHHRHSQSQLQLNKWDHILIEGPIKKNELEKGKFDYLSSRYFVYTMPSKIMVMKHYSKTLVVISLIRKYICNYFRKSFTETIHPFPFLNRLNKIIYGHKSSNRTEGKGRLKTQSLNGEEVSNDQRKLIKIDNKTFEIGDLSSGLILAMVLGDKSYLPRELKNLYINTGTYHSLAISGLHIGIIVFLLSLLGRYWKTLRRKNQWKMLSIIFIWLYSIIIGMCPSVTRASLMFTLYIISTIFQRNSSIYSLLFFSLYIQLLIFPEELQSLGLILSYGAVIGILYFYPKLKDLYSPKKKILRFPLNILYVSMAANIVTYPIISYYFSSFPIYNIFTNVVISPLVPMIIVLAFLLLALGRIDLFNSILSLSINSIIELKISILKVFNSLPFSLIHSEQYSLLDVLVYYLLLFLFTRFIYRREFYILILIFTSSLVYFLFSLISDKYGTESVLW